MVQIFHTSSGTALFSLFNHSSWYDPFADPVRFKAGKYQFGGASIFSMPGRRQIELCRAFLLLDSSLESTGLCRLSPTYLLSFVLSMLLAVWRWLWFRKDALCGIILVLDIVYGVLPWSFLVSFGLAWQINRLAALCFNLGVITFYLWNLTYVTLFLYFILDSFNLLCSAGSCLTSREECGLHLPCLTTYFKAGTGVNVNL